MKEQKNALVTKCMSENLVGLDFIDGDVAKEGKK